MPNYYLSSPPVINVVLSIKPRLLREMMQRAFSKIAGIKVVGEHIEKENLNTTINENDVQWVVVDTDDEDNFEEIFDSLQLKPSITLLGVAMDGSYMKLHWTEIHRQKIQNPTLDELIDLLQRGIKGTEFEQKLSS